MFVDVVKSYGLVLVVDKFVVVVSDSIIFFIVMGGDIFGVVVDLFLRLLKGVDGVLKWDGILKFCELIDV